jgi:hypothetical protein
VVVEGRRPSAAAVVVPAAKGDMGDVKEDAADEVV